jgi:hypothetical protein
MAYEDGLSQIVKYAGVFRSLFIAKGRLASPRGFDRTLTNGRTNILRWSGFPLIAFCGTGTGGETLSRCQRQTHRHEGQHEKTYHTNSDCRAYNFLMEIYYDAIAINTACQMQHILHCEAFLFFLSPRFSMFREKPEMKRKIPMSEHTKKPRGM